MPSSRQYQSWVKTVGNTIAELGSRIKNIQNSLVGETNHPVGIGNASRIGSVMHLGDNSKHQKAPCLLAIRRCFTIQDRLREVYPSTYILLDMFRHVKYSEENSATFA